MEKIQIAIDGPAGAGKSTVAREVAAALDYLYIDTGAMYRALTYVALDKQLNLDDGGALKSLLMNTSIELVQVKDEEQKVFVNGLDISRDIRTHAVTNHVSTVSAHKEVREEMVHRQRLLAEDGGVVMDGRDIGTHVLTEAELKVFLSASVHVRAERRYQQLKEKGIDASLDQIKMEIERRDKLDSERETSPLEKAPDAYEIDTTNLTISQVVSTILGLVEARK